MKSRQAAGDGRSHEKGKEKAWPIKWAVILTPGRGEEAWPKMRTDLTTHRRVGFIVRTSFAR